MSWQTTDTFSVGQVLGATAMNKISSDLNWLYGGRYAKTAYTDVVSTVTETDLLAGGITVAAGALGTTGRMRAVLVGDILYNRSSADTLTLRVSLGGTDLYYSGLSVDPWTLTGYGIIGTRRPFTMVLDVMMQGAANQVVLGGVNLVGDATAPTTGLGGVGRYQSVFGSNGAVTINTAIACAFTVKVQWSNSDSKNSCAVRTAQFFVESV